jgi:hypothetical protein
VYYLSCKEHHHQLPTVESALYTGVSDAADLSNHKRKGAVVVNKIIPFRNRPLDIAIVAFFLINLLFITYVIDLEQLVVPYAAHFTYPIWPPRQIVDLVQSYGHLYDHDLLARPVWWKMTIWLDDLVFGPFYVVAIYAYVKGKNWIRMPSVIYSTILLTNVIIILGEEYAGQWAAPNFLMVLLSNLAWLVFPLIIIGRMWRSERPFTQPVPVRETGTAAEISATARPEALESSEAGQ